MFCKNCGKEMEKDATVCANCGTPVEEPQKAPKPKRVFDMSPLTIVGMVMSSIAFMLGLILISISLAHNNIGRLSLDLLILLPLLVGIGFSTYALVAFKKKKGDLLLNIISLGLATFTLLYMFISAAVILG